MKKTFLLLLLFAGMAVQAQVRTTVLGAMNALNGNRLTATVSPAATMLPPLTANPVAPVISPMGRVPGVSYSDLYGGGDVDIYYQSAYSWYLGYTDYLHAAQSITFNGDGSQVELGNSGVYIPASADLASAVNFFVGDDHFTPFKDFSARQVTMIVRGNKPKPVVLVADAAGYVIYTPEVTDFKTAVSLNLQ
jgi:hypothetical protein